MHKFNIPTKKEVSSTNREIFDDLEKELGFVPNLLATYAYSNNALKNYIEFTNTPSSLKAKEKEAISLAVSQVNNSDYCLATHTTLAKMYGFNNYQILELRQGKASFDSKLNTLVALAKNITEKRGNTNPIVLKNFFNSGWTRENLIDLISHIGDKTITNYVNNTVKIPIDFPLAPPLY